MDTARCKIKCTIVNPTWRISMHGTENLTTLADLPVRRMRELCRGIHASGVAASRLSISVTSSKGYFPSSSTFCPGTRSSAIPVSIHFAPLSPYRLSALPSLSNEARLRLLREKSVLVIVSVDIVRQLKNPCAVSQVLSNLQKQMRKNLCV